MKKPSVALVGVSGYGRIHYKYLKSLAEAGKIEFAAAVILPECMALEPVMEKVKELRAMGATIYPSVDALLAERSTSLDLVCLPVGIAVHRALTCKFLAAGINVLLEKPAAGCVEDVEIMIEAERRSGKFVAVGFNDMYGRDIHAIKQEILSGKYGELKNISFKGAWGRHDRYYGRNGWAGKMYTEDGSAILDSPINNAFAHFLNIALFCAGPDFRVTAHVHAMQAELVRARDTIETFDTCGVRMLAGNDIPIQMLMTHACAENIEPYLRFELEYGQIHWDSSVNKWYILNARGEKIREEDIADCRESMFNDVIARLSDPDAFVYTLENAMEHTFCIENLHRLFPVKKLAANEYRIIADMNNQREIPGILEIFDTAFGKNLLPSEAGASWSPPAAMKYLEKILLTAASQ